MAITRSCHGVSGLQTKGEASACHGAECTAKFSRQKWHSSNTTGQKSCKPLSLHGEPKLRASEHRGGGVPYMGSLSLSLSVAAEVTPHSGAVRHTVWHCDQTGSSCEQLVKVPHDRPERPKHHVGRPHVYMYTKRNNKRSKTRMPHIKGEPFVQNEARKKT